MSAPLERSVEPTAAVVTVYGLEAFTIPKRLAGAAAGSALAFSAVLRA
jgi:hypothetical protein